MVTVSLIGLPPLGRSHRPPLTKGYDEMSRAGASKTLGPSLQPHCPVTGMTLQRSDLLCPPPNFRRRVQSGSVKSLGSACCQVVVDIEELNVGLTLHADLLSDRADLLFGEVLEVLLGLPDIGHPDPVGRFRHAVEHASGSARALGRESHSFDDLVVLVERHALEVELDSSSHLSTRLELHAKQVLCILGEDLVLHR